MAHSEQAEPALATFHLGHVPAADIPVLTLAKWIYSTSHDWGTENEDLGRKRSLARVTGVAFTPEEARRLFYEDLKRAIDWIPDTGVGLSWDDEALDLTITWDPDNLTPAAEPVFVRLDEVLHIGRNSPGNVIVADAASAAAWNNAVATVDRQPVLGPAFRVDLGKLPELFDEFEQRHARTNAKDGIDSDPRIQFKRETLTIEFDNWRTIQYSGLQHDLTRLAEDAQGPRNDHPAAPVVRTHITAQFGADYRKILRAFGVPGHSHDLVRQRARRSITADLTPATLAGIYAHYDKTLTTKDLKGIHQTIARARSKDDYRPAFRELFKHGGFIIGEDHSSPDAIAFVNSHFETLRNSGCTHLVYEGFHATEQPLLDHYFDTGDLHPGLEVNIKLADDTRGGPVFRTLLERARDYQIRIIAPGDEVARLRPGVGRLSNSELATSFDREKRLIYYNMTASRISANLPPNAKVVNIVGGAHVHPTPGGLPGLAQLYAQAAVVIGRSNGKLIMGHYREPANARRRAPTIGRPPPDVQPEMPSRRRTLAHIPRIGNIPRPWHGIRGPQ